jgi:hypothetical protein
MSAERDGRPVSWRNGPRGAAAKRGSAKRAWRSQAPLKRPRNASDREAIGGRQAPLPWAPNAAPRRFAPSRAPWGPRITDSAGHVMARNGGRAVLENVPHTLRGCMGTFSRGAPSGSAYRRSAQRQRSRPSRRPKVAATARVRRPTLATAGRRAGAEAKPHVTEGPWPEPGAAEAVAEPGAAFSAMRVAEPVIAERRTTGRRPKRNRRNDWLRARGPRTPRVIDSPFHVLPAARGSRTQQDT